MRLYPGESKRARFYADSSIELQVEVDGVWYDLEAGVENEAGAWTADPEGTVHTIWVAHSAAAFPPGGALILSPGVHSTRLRRVDTGEMLIQNTDPFLVSGEATWPVEWGSIPRPDDAELLRKSEELAVAALRDLTVGRVGGYITTVMPCGGSCGHKRHAWDPHWHGGKFVNVCGCGDNCSCAPVASVALEPPVASIENVTVDGFTVSPANYRVEDGYLLVRTDGVLWPSCASDDFTVTYISGHRVDALGAQAAGVLAAEFAKALSGDTRGCRLPSGIVSVTRQGITMDLAGGLFPEGLTGLTEVDVWVRSWNPHALKAAPMVYSPDLDRYRRVTWSGS